MCLLAPERVRNIIYAQLFLSIRECEGEIHCLIFDACVYEMEVCVCVYVCKIDLLSFVCVFYYSINLCQD